MNFAWPLHLLRCLHKNVHDRGLQDSKADLAGRSRHRWRRCLPAGSNAASVAKALRGFRDPLPARAPEDR